jgi:hypothetical protein
MYRVSQVLPPARLTLLKNYETLGFKCVQSIFPYHFIQSRKILKTDFEKKKSLFVHAHNSQLIQRTCL